MNNLVPDISRHELQCKAHKAKAEAFCPAPDCEHRLFCFTCICKLTQHPHNIDDFENINNLFKPPKEEFFVNNEKIIDISNGLVEVSERLENKMDTAVKNFKGIIDQLRDSSQMKPKLESLNSTKEYIQAQQEKLNNYYRSCNFPQKIVENEELNGFIGMYVKGKKELKNNRLELGVGRLESSLEEVCNTIDSLSARLKAVKDNIEGLKFSPEGPHAESRQQNRVEVNVKSRPALSIFSQMELNEPVKKPVDLLNIQSFKQPQEKYKHQAQKRSTNGMLRVFAEKPDNEKNLVAQPISRNSGGNDQIQNPVESPVADQIDLQTTQTILTSNPNVLPSQTYQVASTINPNSVNDMIIEESVTRTEPEAISEPNVVCEPKIVSELKIVTEPKVVDEPKTVDESHREVPNPLEKRSLVDYFRLKDKNMNRDMLLRLITTFFEKDEFKPKLDELIQFTNDQAQAFGLQKVHLEFRRLGKLTERAKSLRSRFEALIATPNQESKQTIIEPTFALLKKLAENHQLAEVKDLKECFQKYASSVKDFMKKKPSSEVVDSLLKELNESKINFSEEVLKLQENITKRNHVLQYFEDCNQRKKKLTLSAAADILNELLSLPISFPNSDDIVDKIFTAHKLKYRLRYVLNRYSSKLSADTARNTLDRNDFLTKEKLEKLLGKIHQMEEFELEDDAQKVQQILNDSKEIQLKILKLLKDNAFDRDPKKIAYLAGLAKKSIYFFPEIIQIIELQKNTSKIPSAQQMPDKNANKSAFPSRNSPKSKANEAGGMQIEKSPGKTSPKTPSVTKKLDFTAITGQTQDMDFLFPHLNPGAKNPFFHNRLDISLSLPTGSTSNKMMTEDQDHLTGDPGKRIKDNSGMAILVTPQNSLGGGAGRSKDQEGKQSLLSKLKPIIK